MDTKKNIETEEVKGPAKKLGLSKIVYGLGMSARDSLVTFVVATAALFFPMYYGQQGKGGIIDKAAKIPDKVHGYFTKNFGGERAGKAGKALAVSAGIASIISYAAHVPGLFRGPRKIAEAEEVFNTEVADNQKQGMEIKALTDTVTRQGMELTEVKRQNASFVERIKTAEPANNNSVAL